MKNTANYKFIGLPLTGLALMGFAITNTIYLVMNNLIPLLNGSYQIPSVPAGDKMFTTFIMTVFGVSLSVLILSNIVMGLLGINAMRVAKNSDRVKKYSGLAVFVLIVGAIFFISGIFSLTSGTTFAECAYLLFPTLAQMAFAAFYIVEVKALK